jgi:hypothetical protein
MLTFTDLQTRITGLFSDSSTATSTLAKSLLNDAKKMLESEYGIEEVQEFVTLTETQKDFYPLPASFKRMRTVRTVETSRGSTTTGVTAGKIIDSAQVFTDTDVSLQVYNKTTSQVTTITKFISATEVEVEDDIFGSGEAYVIADGLTYIGEHVNQEDVFDAIKSPSFTVTSSAFSHYYIENRNFRMYPRPDADDNLMIYSYLKNSEEFSREDETAGTIVANRGSTAVVGSGTTFTNMRSGDYLQTSDNLWYKVDTIVDATNLKISSPYESTNITGASFKIGQVPLIDQQFHNILSYKPISELYRRREELENAREYAKLWKDSVDEIKEFAGSKKVTSPSVRMRMKRRPGRVFFRSPDVNRLVTRS